MPHKCPLCLKELGQSEELVRFCQTHWTTQQFNCIDNPTAIFCTAGDGRCNESPDSGVFLRHIACEAKNPFWDETKRLVELPGDDNPTLRHTNIVRHQVRTSNGFSDREVFHWEAGMLRSMPPDVEEMWYPLMLLRATTEISQRRRVGVLVELAGAKRVGKTVVAVQAMDAKGYASNGKSNRGLTLKDYVYSRRPDGQSTAVVPLVEMFYIRDIMERNHSFDPEALGTRPDIGDLKVVFIEPSSNSDSSKPNQNGRVTGGMRAFGSDVWSQIKELLGFSARVGATSSNHPFWYTLLFYDTAGELAHRGSQILNRIEEFVEKAAIFVNAVELVDASHDTTLPDSSVIVATRRLKSLRGKKNIESCLVVTHLDVARGNLAVEDWERIKQIAGDVDSSASDDKEARRLLIKWLRTSNDPNVKNLEKLLKGVKVFFVWTEGIPTDESQNKGARTYSFGLERFVCWCLGTQWDEITHIENLETES